MVIKERPEPFALKVLRILNVRGELTKAEKDQHWRLERGYEGEVKFDQLSKKLSEERYIINDLLLEVDGNTFQLDTVIIEQGSIRPIDVKYHQGDYFIEDGELYSLPYKNKCKNPFAQLKRSVDLLTQLLQKNQFHFLIDAKLVFINPEFTLFQVSKDAPIILSTSLKRYLNNIDRTPSKLSEEHKRLASLLLSLHQTKNPYEKIPLFKYEDLKKGPYCNKCNSVHISVEGHELVCRDCGVHEKFEVAVLRLVAEFKLLFPEIKITTGIVYDWCGGSLSKRVIWKALKKHYKVIGSGRWMYFEEK